MVNKVNKFYTVNKFNKFNRDVTFIYTDERAPRTLPSVSYLGGQ